jgi:hypothetical protein
VNAPRALTRADARPCTRCAVRPRARGQRWCRECHGAYKRKAAATARETETGRGSGQRQDQPHPPRAVKPGVVAAGQTPGKKGPPEPVTPPAPYVPYDGLEPAPAAAPREAWYSVFLSELAERGLMALAAARAGVHISTVYRRREADRDFAAEIEVARSYYADHLEWESVTLGRIRGNPLPYFARLKAERPSRYIDRQAVLIGTVESLSPEEGRALLQAMLDLPPAEGALEAAGPDPARVVLDGEPSGPESAQTAE